MQHLTIVTTGGTIDKIYFDDKSQFQIGDPQIGDILRTLGVDFTFDVLPVMRKDSLHMDDHDRVLIRDAIVRRIRSRSSSVMCRLSLRISATTSNSNATPRAFRMSPICGAPI